jgi:hypothetical protein
MDRHDRHARPTESESASSWTPPAIEWEEPYQPSLFAASCTLQPGNCAGGAQN